MQTDTPPTADREEAPEMFGRWKPPFSVAHCGQGTGKSQLLSGGAAREIVYQQCPNISQSSLIDA